MAHDHHHDDWLEDQNKLAQEEADDHLRSLGWQDLGFTDLTTGEPIGYDSFGAPIYPHQVDREVVVAWGNPEPVRIQFSIENVDPEILELVYGAPVVPLCERRIPAEGTE